MEQVRSIHIEVEVDTNKRTITKTIDVSSLEGLKDRLNDLFYYIKADLNAG